LMLKKKMDSESEQELKNNDTMILLIPELRPEKLEEKKHRTLERPHIENWYL